MLRGDLDEASPVQQREVFPEMNLWCRLGWHDKRLVGIRVDDREQLQMRCTRCGQRWHRLLSVVYRERDLPWLPSLDAHEWEARGG